MIDDNAIVGQKSNIMNLKKTLIDQRWALKNCSLVRGRHQKTALWSEVGIKKLRFSQRWAPKTAHLSEVGTKNCSLVRGGHLKVMGGVQR